jgi:conjugal transfer/type IV secretion protein DotA/TraY
MANARETYINKPYDFTINPFIQAQILGESMRTAAITMYGSVVAISGVTSIVSNIPWVGGFFAAGWEVLNSITLSALVALYGGGVVLAIGLPILLFITLFVLTTHWIYQLFVTVIAVSVFLPIMLAKMSNQMAMDQKEEKAMMALLSMTLRPILGVTSAFIAIGILYIVFGLFNYAWWRFVGIMFPTTNVTETVVLMMAYSWLVFMIIANGISFINTLQENIEDITHGGSFRSMPMNENMSRIEGMGTHSAQIFSTPKGSSGGGGKSTTSTKSKVADKKTGGDGVT